MLLDEYIERGHGKRESRVEIRPDPVHDLLEVTHERQHGEYRLHQQAVLPLTALTQFEVGRIALGGMEGGITQDDHASAFAHARGDASPTACPRPCDGVSY